MSDSNRTRVTVIKETTPGTTPDLPTMKTIPHARQTMKGGTNYRESGIIRADANVQGVYPVSKAPQGMIDTELFYSPSGEGLELLISGALRSAATSAASEVTAVGAASGVLSATGIETDVEVGDVVRVRTSGDVIIGYYPVTARGTDSITCAGGVPNGSDYKVLRGRRNKNGTTEDHFSVEVARLDTGTPLYQIVRGWCPGRMSLRVADEQISTISFEGQALNTARGTSAYGQAYDPATDHESMTSTGVPTILIGNAVYEATDCTVDFDSRIVGRRRIGTEGPGSLRRGRMRVTGTINVYLDAWTEIDKHEAGSVSSLVLGMESSDGYAYSLSIPELRWTQAMTDTEGPDLDDFARLSFQGELDATEGITARWQSFAA